MNVHDIEQARLLEHAVEGAVAGLDREEWLELQRQVGKAAQGPDEGFERAAAAIDLARQPSPESMPAQVAAAAVAAADRYFTPRRTPAVLPRAASPPGWFVYGGWIAAAASFIAAVGLVLTSRSPAPPPSRELEARVADAVDATGATAAGDQVATGEDGARRPAARDVARDAERDVPPRDVAASRQALASQRFVLARNWSPGGDPAGREVGGDVVWDARTQSGYLRFTGLRRNDRSREQYQLWIFDGRRDQRYPVDGGVFDIDEDGEVVVPIHAALPVGTPLAFAVTLERPGGVVVSDRSRVVVIAQVG